MNDDIIKINKDFSDLFTKGRSMLDEGCSAVVNSYRDESFKQFLDLNGVPNKSEDYRYSDLVSIFKHDYFTMFKLPPLNVNMKEVFLCKVSDLNSTPILMVNGWYHDECNELKGLDSDIVVCGMREASLKYPDIFAKHYNKYTIAAKNDSLISLNTAFAQDGLFIYVPDNTVVDIPLQLINILNTDKDYMGFQRNLIVLGKNAKLDLLTCEHTLSNTSFLINNTTEIVVGENSHCDYYQIQSQHSSTNYINSLFVEQKASSVFESNIITLFGGYIRNNLYVALSGKGADARLYGLYTLDKKQKVDNFVFVDHKVPHCTSDQHYKGILDDYAVGDFAGAIYVRPDAQKTEAYQVNNNLLLTDTALMHAKPQLVIDADDVKCSHGATSGQIDDEALFYLRSRGIGLKEAKTMLMFGFAHDIIQKVKLEPLRNEIDFMIDKRLRNEYTGCKNCVYSTNVKKNS